VAARIRKDRQVGQNDAEDMFRPFTKAGLKSIIEGYESELALIDRLDRQACWAVYDTDDGLLLRESAAKANRERARQSIEAKLETAREALAIRGCRRAG